MDGKERRQQLIALLKTTSEPLTGTALARLLGVSRQVIVGDMAILRAAGCEIYATPQGYVLPAAKVPTAVIAKLACSHDRNRMAEELNIILDHGGKVLDVIVEHGVYGEIKANLMLGTRRDLEAFLISLEKSGAEPLSLITGGIHLHTIEAPAESALEAIKAELNERNILLS